ncbi:MAG: cytochrome c3 family protein [Alphaproteobacteria bacterium]|nr:cytochrome c3 family protein [Alphaproteobacteria bacterium]
MRRFRDSLPKSGALALSLVMAMTFTGCEHAGNTSDTEREHFPIESHSLLGPDRSEGEWRVSVGTFPQGIDEQPIAFNHSIHAKPVADGGLGMDCQYCHSNARESRHAGVPATQVCMNCHKMIDPAGRKPLEQLKGYYDRGEPTPWVKVHDLPDFVYFNHSQHLKGGLQCTECHADMAQHTVAVRDPDMAMTMGWCLNCHREHPSVDENYGTKAEQRRAELKDCYTCHQ